jgi:DNA-binding XRE family transcriptional regulator
MTIPQDRFKGLLVNGSASTDTSSSSGDALHIDARFGARIRELRKERQWTQLYMAIHCGIDRSHISDVERGYKSMTLSLMEVVALGFEISLSELLDRL